MRSSNSWGSSPSVWTASPAQRYVTVASPLGVALGSSPRGQRYSIVTESLLVPVTVMNPKAHSVAVPVSYTHLTLPTNREV